MRGRGPGGARGRRGSGRAARERARSRPPGARALAAESSARVASMLHALLRRRGVRVEELARLLGVKAADVSRWRRGRPVPGYRRAEIEGKLARIEVVADEETGEIRLALGGE